MRGNYTIAPSSDENVRIMGMKNSILRQWFYERLDKEEGKKTSIRVLHGDFWTFSTRNQVFKKTTFVDFVLELKQIIQETGDFFTEKDSKNDGCLLNYALKTQK